MNLAQRLSWGLLALSALGLPARAAAAALPDTPGSNALQARIARVEQGLSTPVAVKDSPHRRMALAERMAFHQVPAVSIAVIDHGRIAWARAYGVLDASGGRPATTTTLFQSGSISKPVSAIGALRLVDKGRLALDQPANRQLGRLADPGQRLHPGPGRHAAHAAQPQRRTDGARLQRLRRRAEDAHLAAGAGRDRAGQLGTGAGRHRPWHRLAILRRLLQRRAVAGGPRRADCPSRTTCTTRYWRRWA